MITLGDKIRAARHRKKWTVVQFTRALRPRVSSAYIADIELHGEAPSPILLRSIAIALGLSYRELAQDVKREKVEKVKTFLSKKYKIA